MHLARPDIGFGSASDLPAVGIADAATVVTADGRTATGDQRFVRSDRSAADSGLVGNLGGDRAARISVLGPTCSMGFPLIRSAARRAMALYRITSITRFG